MTLASGGLTVAGTIEGTTITASTALVPDASGGADIGSTSLEWGDLYIADDKKIYLGSDQNFSIEYDEDGNDTTAVVAAGGVSLAPHGTSTGNGTELRFQELAANGANYVGFKAPDAIASNEVWVLPNADGSADQVLKTDGSNNLSWGSAGGGESFTAKGAIANKRLVSVVMDGTGRVEETFQKRSVVRGTADQYYWFQDDSDYPVLGGNYSTSNKNIIYDPDTDRHVIQYQDGSDSYKLKAVVGSLNNSSGTSWTYGTAVAVDTGYHYDSGVSTMVYDTNSNKLVIFFRDPGNSNNLSAIVGTVTGGTSNTTSWGTKVSIGDGHDVQYVSAAFDTNVNKCLVCYRGENNYLKAVSFTVSGTGGSFGTVKNLNNEATSHISVDFQPSDDNKFSAVAYRKNNGYGCARGISIASDGTIDEHGGETVYNYATSEYNCIAHNPISPEAHNYDEYVVVYRDQGNSNYLTGKIIEQNSTGTVGSTTEVTLKTDDCRGGRLAFHAESGRWNCVYNTGSVMKGLTFTLGFYSLAYNEQADPTSTMTSSHYGDTVYDPVQETCITIIGQNHLVSSNKHGWSYIITPGKPDNHDGYIGVAATAASDGGTVLVKTLGMVAETEKTNLSYGISASTTSAYSNGIYYLQRSSTTSTQSSAWSSSHGTANTLVGRAITSSKIIVSYNFGGAGHDDDYQVRD
jgi:hypothetical protein